MINVGIVPLDSRPVNTTWLCELANIANINTIMFSRELAGDLFRGAKIDDITSWLRDNANKMDYLILSTDAICFGGLVQARTANIDVVKTIQKLEVLEEIKKNNPKLKIYCFDTVMRNAMTALDDERLKYYQDMLEYAVLKGKCYFFKNEKEIKRLSELEESLPSWIKDEYMLARTTKRTMNEKFIDYYASGIIDKYILLQEDSTPFGIQAIDQEYINAHIKEVGLDGKVNFYNGTDEGGAVMLALIVREVYNLSPKVYVDIYDESCLDKCHLFEDRPFRENLDKMFKTIGITKVDDINEASSVLSIFGVKDNILMDLNHYYEIPIDKNSHYLEYIKNLNEMAKTKNTFLADLYFPNGGSKELLDDLDYFDLKGYSAWNTASNTMGTLLCQLICYYVCSNEELNNDFNRKRYIDDCIYQYITRRKVTESFIKKGISQLNLRDHGLEIKKLIDKDLKKYKSFIQKDFDTVLPWNRMFEIEIILK